MREKIYIDGHAGTTGLRIHDWLSTRRDIEVVTLPVELRGKNTDARREVILSSDIAILCLPDDAAREVAGWVTDADTRLIDASTAHRVAEGWVYGLPELQPVQRDLIKSARFVSNTGCHAAAFILLIRPLVDEKNNYERFSDNGSFAFRLFGWGASNDREMGTPRKRVEIFTIRITLCAAIRPQTCSGK